MTLAGKGCFIWRVKDCEAGDPNAIASVATEANFSHVLVKIADGTFTYNFDWDQNVDLVLPVAQALKAHEIQVWGWHYVYGESPVGEARKAIQRIEELNLDGYVIDAEAHYKDPEKKDAARRFMRELRRNLPNFPIALTSYRFPSYHPQLPWREFLEKCDLNLPQIYWEFSHNPEIQLARSLREFQDLTPFRPVIPVGPAYRRGNWLPSPTEITNFMETARTLNLKAANFWEWSRVRKPELADLWETIRDFPWSGGTVPSDIVDRYFAFLNEKDPHKVANIYAPTAAHVTSNQTISGLEAIRGWYQSLFNTTVPNATFTLTSSSGSGNTRNFTWTATSDYGEIENGNDVFGLLDGKVVYHYTFFSIT
jgi:hypothetical protein